MNNLPNILVWGGKYMSDELVNKLQDYKYGMTVYKFENGHFIPYNTNRDFFDFRSDKWLTMEDGFLALVESLNLCDDCKPNFYTGHFTYIESYMRLRYYKKKVILEFKRNALGKMVLDHPKEA